MMMTEGKVATIIHKLGIHIDRERGDELIALCPGHELRTGRPDSSPSWSINSETGLHHCFSCGYKGSLISLVAEQKEFFTDWNRLDLAQAKSWLSSNTDVDLDVLVKNLDMVRESYISIPKPVEMSEARLSLFSKEIPAWALQSRGITQVAANRYGVLWDIKTNSWILPVRNFDTEGLLGWQEKGELTRHFMNRPPGMMKSKTLFNGFTNQAEGHPVSIMTVVESPLDAVRLYSEGFLGGVATFGASVSSDQLNLFRRAETLIFAFDNPRIDKAGRTASLQMLEFSRKEGLECKFFNYGDSEAKDIGEMSKDEIKFGLENAKHCVLGKAAIL